MKKLIIKHGRLINTADKIGENIDILIEDGKVVAIRSNLCDSDAQVIDARGMVVSAGLIDIHVHLREPGFEYKETIETGCAAAATADLLRLPVCPIPSRWWIHPNWLIS